MRVRVKICGLTEPDGIAAAVEAGADAVGFVFADSPRRVSPHEAGALARELPPFVTRVAVFRHAESALARAALRELGPALCQVDAAERPLFDALGAHVLPVVRDGEPVPETIGEDGAVLYEAAESGRGLRADWERARGLATSRPVVLAGGLDATNVASALRAVRPFAVDVSSGVERAPGIKDPASIRRFVAAVRAAEEL